MTLTESPLDHCSSSPPSLTAHLHLPLSPPSLRLAVICVFCEVLRHLIIYKLLQQMESSKRTIASQANEGLLPKRPKNSVFHPQTFKALKTNSSSQYEASVPSQSSIPGRRRLEELVSSTTRALEPLEVSFNGPKAIPYLKERFQLKVCNVNFPHMHYYRYCYKRIDKDYEKVLEENKDMKTKVFEYEDIIRIVVSVDA
ncbi:hypothetical protein LguiB_023417 [Lonicera macranthoides]